MLGAYGLRRHKQSEDDGSTAIIGTKSGYVCGIPSFDGPRELNDFYYRE
jgi:hypothetical protein